MTKIVPKKLDINSQISMCENPKTPSNHYELLISELRTNYSELLPLNPCILSIGTPAFNNHVQCRDEDQGEEGRNC